MNVAIVKYNAGNIFSVNYALRRLGISAEITDDHEKIRNADKVIFPGVGEAGTTMRYLREYGLDRLICSLNQPVLGICIGLQLMCSYSEEGDTECLGIFDEKVLKFKQEGGFGRCKIPHMGWNIVTAPDSPLFKGLPSEPYMYYVHSYRALTGKHTTGITGYAGNFSASLQKDNFYAVQFHPEKSGILGARILSNFLSL